MNALRAFTATLPGLSLVIVLAVVGLVIYRDALPLLHAIMAMR